jgi:hypothetical protein
MSIASYSMKQLGSSLPAEAVYSARSMPAGCGYCVPQMCRLLNDHLVGQMIKHFKAKGAFDFGSEIWIHSAKSPKSQLMQLDVAGLWKLDPREPVTPVHDCRSP